MPAGPGGQLCRALQAALLSGTWEPRRELGAGEGCDLTYPCGCRGAQGRAQEGTRWCPPGEE